ncbi:hypothetical protein [Roseomonas sp. BN140053]|uniref:hypothetical protein n=1 Tax=Roseomonas sp. BN140053 TaxID=3391898 RepID=UPI0039E83A70
MRATIAVALLVLAGCTTPPPPAAPAPAPRPEEAFRPACQQRWQTTFAVEKCMVDEYDRSQGRTPPGG